MWDESVWFLSHLLSMPEASTRVHCVSSVCRVLGYTSETQGTSQWFLIDITDVRVGDTKQGSKNGMYHCNIFIFKSEMNRLESKSCMSSLKAAICKMEASWGAH